MRVHVEFVGPVCVYQFVLLCMCLSLKCPHGSQQLLLDLCQYLWAWNSENTLPKSFTWLTCLTELL